MKAKGFIIYPGKLTVVDSFRIGCIGRIDHHVMGRVVKAAGEALEPVARHAGARRLFCGAVGIRLRRRRQASARVEARHHVSDHDRLRAAQIRPRRREAPRASTRCSTATSAQLDAMGAAIVVTADHGMKPKHNADGSPCGHLRPGPAGRLAGQGRGPRDPADHRPLRRASRRARLLCHRLPARGRGPRGYRGAVEGAPEIAGGNP